MDPILEQCKRIMENHYGAKYAGLVVYGSKARNDMDPESDIDILVLIKEPFDYFEELRKITDLLYPTQLISDQLISAKPAGLEEFEMGTLQLYRNAKREGVMV